MSRLTDVMDRVFYPDQQRSWDDALFRGVVLDHLGPDRDLLDLGAGAGILSEMSFRGRARKVCGVDLDERVVDNPFLDEAKIGGAEGVPYGDGTFDVVICNNVLEHLPAPERVFAEVARVLRPGGVFLAKTPNATHYVPLMARLTPQWFHEWFNRLRGRDEEDTFPTLYRANTEPAIRELARRSGLEVRRIDLVEGRPEYLRMWAPTYACGVAYERIVSSTDLLRYYRVLLVVVLEKPAT